MKKMFFYLAMAGIVLELTYLNNRSLKYLVEDYNLIGKVFSIIGASVFAMMTILIMRSSNKKWMKVVFPIFDMMLVLFGFNLRFADNLLGNPVAFGLTIFISIFTGLITFSLGTINVSDKETDSERKTSTDNKNRMLQSELFEKQNEIIHLKSQISGQTGIIEKAKTDIENLQSKISKIESEKQKYRHSHLLFEQGRIRKKKLQNRTAEELETLNECTTLL
jgi:hypothetical protein